MEGDHSCQANGDQAVELVFGDRADVQSATNQRQKQRQCGQRADKPKFFGDDRKYEVGMGCRKKLVLGLGAFDKSFARLATGSNGYFRLDNIPTSS